MRQLTESERAYRRGALQAVQFLSNDPWLIGCPAKYLRVISDWVQELMAGRTSLDPQYLGIYMDEIRDRVMIRREESII